MLHLLHMPEEVVERRAVDVKDDGDAPDVLRKQGEERRAVERVGVRRVDVDDVRASLEGKQSDRNERREEHPRGEFEPLALRRGVAGVDAHVHAVFEVATLFGDVAVDAAGTFRADDEECLLGCHGLSLGSRSRSRGPSHGTRRGREVR